MSTSIPMGAASSLRWDNCSCNVGCDTTTTATQRKMNVLKKSTALNAGQSKAMRMASYANTTPGLSTVGNKKQVFVSNAPTRTCTLPGIRTVDGTQCQPAVGDWTPATKAKFAWLTGCSNSGLACAGQNQTTLDDAAFKYTYPARMFGR
jgi:hypothetical protein